MTSSRQSFSSGSDFESSYGYVRAVRVGSWIWVSGCTAMGRDGAVGGSDVAAQTEEALGRVLAAVVSAGGSAADIVRTRTFVRDIKTWQQVGAVHRRLLGPARPAATIVEVSGLVDPSLLVEIEADAFVEPDQTGAATATDEHRRSR